MGLFTLITAVVLSGTAGLVAGRFLGRNRSADSERSAADTIPANENLKDKFKIESMMDSLHDLTDDVGSQVGRHAIQVSEFSASLSHGDSASVQPLISASESLVESNAELQTALAAAKVELERQREELRTLIKEARTDALTGLPNRRSLDQELNRLIAIYRRKATPFAIIMLDIDRFKSINDGHGHMIGDQILKAFGRCLQSTFRDMDVVARYGGEEFAALLPHTRLNEALLAAERTRAAISVAKVKGANVELTVTASLGVKEVASGETAEDLIKHADQALYAAKRGGRNCCYYHDGTTVQRYSSNGEMESDNTEPDQDSSQSISDSHSTESSPDAA